MSNRYFVQTIHLKRKSVVFTKMIDGGRYSFAIMSFDDDTLKLMLGATRSR